MNLGMVHPGNPVVTDGCCLVSAGAAAGVVTAPPVLDHCCRYSRSRSHSAEDPLEDWIQAELVVDQAS